VREGDLRGGVGGHGGDAGVAADPEKLEADGDPGELGADRADIGDHERGAAPQPRPCPTSPSHHRRGSGR